MMHGPEGKSMSQNRSPWKLGEKSLLSSGTNTRLLNMDGQLLTFLESNLDCLTSVLLFLALLRSFLFLECVMLAYV